MKVAAKVFAILVAIFFFGYVALAIALEDLDEVF